VRRESNFICTISDDRGDEPTYAGIQISEVIEIAYLKALFAFARCIGIIGHLFDQKRLKAGLYRHPWDDIVCRMEKA
jgi:hypothetical protein